MKTKDKARQGELCSSVGPHVSPELRKGSGQVVLPGIVGEIVSICQSW